MLGQGSYDDEHEAVHNKTGAQSSILIVLNGNKGNGMSCKFAKEHLRLIPDLLRTVANNITPEIEEDIKQIDEAVKKGKPNAKSTTEDSGPQSFAG